MSRTTTLKIFFSALCVSIAAAPALAALPNQPSVEPPAGAEHGVYSVTDQALGGSDPAAAIAYDNFTLSSAYNLSGATWTGIYAEPLPGALSETDFIVSIWGDSGGAPDLSSAILSWNLDGGPASGSGPDVTVVGNGDVSTNTASTPGGGPGFDYSTTSIGGTLGAGSYWISIQADQRFDNVAPVVDPEWQWHTAGDGDGFYLEDLAINQELVRDTDKDLAFSLQGTVVPEPSSALLGLLGMLSIGMLRRKR